MNPIVGPFYAFALLLTAAGWLKLRDPRPTAGALIEAGLPGSRRAVNSIACLEIAIGGTALTTGSRWAAMALALAYTTFAGFVVVARIRGLQLATCGCFGKEDTPPSAAHLVAAVAAVGAGGWVAADPVGSIGGVLNAQPWGGVPLLVATAVTAYLLYVMLTALAQITSMVPGALTAGGTDTTREGA